MKKIRTFFQPYIDVSKLSETIADGEIQKVEMTDYIVDVAKVDEQSSLLLCLLVSIIALY